MICSIQGCMRFDILTIFPKIFDSYFNESILKRAQKKGLIKIVAHDIRKYSKDKHKKVDDKPYGGGAGMVMLFEPIAAAVAAVKRKSRSAKRRKVILFSTRGKKFNSKVARRLALCDQLILICGRYEGVDERVAKHIADAEISMGDFVLTGGEIPAMTVVDAVSRQIPGVLGKKESLEERQGSYPTYTRPEVIMWKRRKLRVPKALLSGDHKKISEWRRGH